MLALAVAIAAPAATAEGAAAACGAANAAMHEAMAIDPRQSAEEIFSAQEREIAVLEQWLADHGK